MNKPQPEAIYDIHEVDQWMNDNYPQFARFRLMDILGGDEVYQNSAVYLSHIDHLVDKEEFAYWLENIRGDMTITDFADFCMYYKILVKEFGASCAIKYWW